MFKILVLLFTLIPAIEIYILFKFGALFGAFNTFVIVILTGIVGAGLAKNQGLVVLNKIQSELGQNKIPANDMIQGLIIFAGGILLLTPGFFTDLLGLSMIFPLTRLFYISVAKDLFAKGVASGNIHVFTPKGHSYSKYSEQETRSEQANNIIEADFTKKN